MDPGPGHTAATAAGLTARRAPAHLLGELGLSVVAGALGAGVFLLVRRDLADAAYANLDYARNLAEHFRWGLAPGQVSNTANSPLNVLLLGGLTALTRLGGGARPVLALGVLTVLLGMLLGWSSARLVAAARLPYLVAPLAVALVLANPFLRSALGTESLLVATVLMLLVMTAAEGRPEWFGVIGGLAAITRLDLLLFVLPVALGTAAIRRKLGWAAAVLLLTGLPWYLFSWFLFGTALPDSLAIRLSPAAGSLAGLSGGPLAGWAAALALGFAPAVLGLVALAGWLVRRPSRRWADWPARPVLAPVAALGLGGPLYLALGYALRVDSPRTYAIAAALVLTVFLTAALGAWWTTARRTGRPLPVRPALAFVLAAALVAGDVLLDVRQGTSSGPGNPLSDDRATAADYARVGAALPAAVGNHVVSGPAEIGTLAYFCACAISGGVSDRGVAIQIVDRQLSAGHGVTGMLVRANYLWLDRRQRPVAPDYQLQYLPGPGTWPVDSPAAGSGHFTLIPVSQSGQ